MIILDTDHLTELQRRDSAKGKKLFDRLRPHADSIAATIVSIEEQLRGRLAGINQNPTGTEQVRPYSRLIELLEFYSGWSVVSFDQAAAQRFLDLRAAKIRIGTMGLKIAAIVLSHPARLLSANLRDFRQVPGLLVEDWLS
jgi:tRNA(fMet)-specific endonuclease VapC